jgi:hypothetical protein
MREQERSATRLARYRNARVRRDCSGAMRKRRSM